MITLEKLAGYEPFDERLAADFIASTNGSVYQPKVGLPAPVASSKTRRASGPRRVHFIAGSNGELIPNSTEGIYGLMDSNKKTETKNKVLKNLVKSKDARIAHLQSQLIEANNRATQAARKAELNEARLRKVINYGKTLRENLGKARKGLYGLGALATASLAGNVYQATKN